MRHKLRKKSRGARKRGSKFIEKEKKKNRPPKGKNGGEEGNIRGRMNEQKFAKTLSFLEDNGQILGFYQEDEERKDFYIWVERKGRCLVLRTEVKSSEYGRDKYNRMTEKMKKQGNNTVADLLVIVRNFDNVLTLSDRIAKDIDRTLRELELS